MFAIPALRKLRGEDLVQSQPWLHKVDPVSNYKQRNNLKTGLSKSNCISRELRSECACSGKTQVRKDLSPQGYILGWDSADTEQTISKALATQSSKTDPYKWFLKKLESQMAYLLVKESKTTILRERITNKQTNKRQGLTGPGTCNLTASAYQVLELQGYICHTWLKTIVLQMLEDLKEDAEKQGK